MSTTVLGNKLWRRADKWPNKNVGLSRVAWKKRLVLDEMSTIAVMGCVCFFSSTGWNQQFDCGWLSTTENQKVWWKNCIVMLCFSNTLIYALVHLDTYLVCNLFWNDLLCMLCPGVLWSHCVQCGQFLSLARGVWCVSRMVPLVSPLLPGPVAKGHIQSAKWLTSKLWETNTYGNLLQETQRKHPRVICTHFFLIKSYILHYVYNFITLIGSTYIHI